MSDQASIFATLSSANHGAKLNEQFKLTPITLKESKRGIACFKIAVFSAAIFLLCVVAISGMIVAIKLGVFKKANSTPNQKISASKRTTNTTQVNNAALSQSDSHLSRCGVQYVKPDLSQLRIINGHVAVKHSWPWIVSIGFNGPYGKIRHACGGTLINKRVVVTANHCVDP